MEIPIYLFIIKSLGWGKNVFGAPAAINQRDISKLSLGARVSFISIPGHSEFRCIFGILYRGTLSLERERKKAEQLIITYSYAYEQPGTGSCDRHSVI